MLHSPLASNVHSHLEAAAPEGPLTALHYWIPRHLDLQSVRWTGPYLPELHHQALNLVLSAVLLLNNGLLPAVLLVLLPPGVLLFGCHPDACFYSSHIHPVVP
jgi:hypothetical protein